MLLLLQLACDRSTYDTPERLLDAPEVAYLGAGTQTDTIGLSGAADAWTVADADATWELRSPAEPDIRALDGQAATVSVRSYAEVPAAVGDTVALRSVVIATETSVEYEAAAREPSSDQPSGFGEGFVRYGDALGTLAVEYWLLTVRELVFATDEGDVALGPSEPTLLVIGGESYLATALSAWESEVLDPAVGQPKCGGIGDRFAYEIVRVPAGEEAEVPAGLERTGDIGSAGCG